MLTKKEKQDEKRLVKAAQNAVGVKSVFTQNAKMKRSSQNGIHLYNFGIPAFKSQNGTLTCPNALNCVSGCYARSGAYIWSNVSQAFEARLKLTQSENFERVIMFHIDTLLARHKSGLVLIRVHDSGDFYSTSYQLAWYHVASCYQNEPRVQFYAYTKMVSQSEKLAQIKPSNFRTIYSFGGREDSQIDTDKHYHSKVFQNDTDLQAQGYIDGTLDDTVAALGAARRIGLVYHGAKSFVKTNWKNVS